MESDNTPLSLLDIHLQNFDFALAGLYDLHRVISPHVELLDERTDHITDAFKRESGLLTPEDRAAVAAKLADLGEVLKTFSEAPDTDSGPVEIDMSGISDAAQEAWWAIVSTGALAIFSHRSRELSSGRSSRRRLPRSKF